MRFEYLKTTTFGQQNFFSSPHLYKHICLSLTELVSCRERNQIGRTAFSFCSLLELYNKNSGARFANFSNSLIFFICFYKLFMQLFIFVLILHAF